MGEIFEQVKVVFVAMPRSRRIMVGLALAITLAIVATAGWFGSRPDYVALYPSLGREDSAAVLTTLRAKGVPHDVQTGGDGKTVVRVPPDRIAGLRMELAEEGIPSASVVEGWSLLDDAPFGESDFKQRINRVRALQGELGRTITGIRNVVGARVHLAIPERGTLRAQREAPSASVYLKLKPGTELTKQQVGGIAHLVAQSVAGLEASRVSIIDDKGRLLHRPQNAPDDLAETDEKKQQLERELEESLVRLIEPVVGRGRVLANVSLEVERARTEETEENFDPDTIAVRSEQKSSDSRGERSETTAIAPGVQSNTPAALQGGGASTAVAPLRTSDANRALDVTNYEVSKTVRRTSIPAGAVRRMSVAIVVDEKLVPPAAEGQQPKLEPRTAEEIIQIQKLARTVVGFDENRGDTIEVVEAPLQEAVDGKFVDPEAKDWVAIFLPHWPWLLLFLLALVAIVIFGRPVSKLLDEAVVRVRGLREGPQVEALVSGEGQLALAAGGVPVSIPGALPGTTQVVELPPGLTPEQQAAAIQALGGTPAAQALASQPATSPPQPPRIDARLHEVLDEMQDDEFDDNAVTKRAERLEHALRELAIHTPHAVAEALTVWMNDRGS